MGGGNYTDDIHVASSHGDYTFAMQEKAKRTTVALLTMETERSQRRQFLTVDINVRTVITELKLYRQFMVLRCSFFVPGIFNNVSGVVFFVFCFFCFFNIFPEKSKIQQFLLAFG